MTVSGLDEVIARSDFLTLHLPLSDETAGKIAGDLEYLRQAMAMPAGGAKDLPKETLDGVLEAMVRPNTADDNTIAIFAALRDDRLDVLDDPALRDAAVRWRQAVVELQERGAAVTAAEGDAFLLLGRVPAVAAAFASFGEDGTTSLAVSPESLDELLANNEVRALVARRIVWGAAQLRETGQQRDAAEELLVEVRRIIATL